MRYGYLLIRRMSRFHGLTYVNTLRVNLYLTGNLIWQPPPEEMSIDTLMTASDTAMTANSAVALTAWGNLQGDAAIEHRNRLRADLKLRLDGGNGVGPARQPKRSAEDRKKGGKPQDGLVDNLVFEFDERNPGASKARPVVYCVGCDRSTSGRDPNRIKAHAKDCNVKILNFNTTCSENFNEDFLEACSQFPNSAQACYPGFGSARSFNEVG